MNKSSFEYFLADEALEKIENRDQLIEEYKLLRKKYVKVTQKLVERVDFERAKDILRDQLNITSDEAINKMKKIANTNNKTLGEVAKMIIMVKEAGEIGGSVNA